MNICTRKLDGIKITISVEDETTLTELLMAIKECIRGLGYNQKGELVFDES